MDVTLWWWIVVVAVILVMLAVDLLVFHREAHEVSAKEAGTWTFVWVGLGILFGGVVAWRFGWDAGGQYLAGYLIEKSLAIDNIFVFAVIFSVLAIPEKYQHRVLFWGVVGALALRAAFIALGAVLLARFHWTIYAFGAFLILTAWKMWRHRHHQPDRTTNSLIQWMKGRFPMADRLDGQRFLTVRGGRRVATPLLAALVAVETADVVLAVDSIPAIFAVTDEPFLVFASNAFAILGLRSMYFFLADLLRRFAYLSVGLAAVLAFVGAKMLLTDLYQVPTFVSLGVISVILGVAIGLSIHRTGVQPHHDLEIQEKVGR